MRFGFPGAALHVLCVSERVLENRQRRLVVTRSRVQVSQLSIIGSMKPMPSRRASSSAHLGLGFTELAELADCAGAGNPGQEDVKREPLLARHLKAFLSAGEGGRRIPA